MARGIGRVQGNLVNHPVQATHPVLILVSSAQKEGKAHPSHLPFFFKLAHLLQSQQNTQCTAVSTQQHKHILYIHTYILYVHIIYIVYMFVCMYIASFFLWTSRNQRISMYQMLKSMVQNLSLAGNNRRAVRNGEIGSQCSSRNDLRDTDLQALNSLSVCITNTI